MLTAACVVADRFEVYKDIFVRDHSNWKDPFIICYKKKINSVLSNYYDLKTREEFYATACFQWEIYSQALDDLTMIKKQIDCGFENSSKRRVEILDELGFTVYWNKASHNNQVSMLSLLMEINDKMCGNLILQTELKRKRVSVTLLYNVFRYKEIFLSSKIHQMETRVRSAIMREEQVSELNDIYYKAMSICMIGKYIFRSDKTLQDMFNFSKIVKLNGSFYAERNTNQFDWCRFSLLLVNENQLIL
jgi:hypothetical protein